MNDYKKPAPEKSPAEIITHIFTNDLFSEKEPKHIANNITQIGKLVKPDANEVSVSSILPKKDNFDKK